MRPAKNGFPTKTAEDFRLLMVALGNSKPGVAAPTPALTGSRTRGAIRLTNSSQEQAL
jgi:hypothetical protein